VCEPFDEREPREWTPVWSLTGLRHRLLPTALLYFHRGRRDASPQLSADSNGNAAGASLEDAIVQGFLELVERDAVALWWYNRTRQPQVDLDAFGEPWVERTRQEYRRLSRHVWALDLTTDLGIPVVVALSRRTWGRRPQVAFGFGAHFDPRVALRRALAEMGQLFGGVLAGGRPPADVSAWWEGMPSFPHPYLMPDAAAPARTPASYGYAPRADLRDDVEEITRLVRAHGLELFVLDQIRPDVGLPVVKAGRTRSRAGRPRCCGWPRRVPTPTRSPPASTSRSAPCATT
jgi:ribosomal protein S12 methylthiotransferase accessory factor